jgi:hypothetical protein
MLMITTLSSCGKGPVLPVIGVLSPSHVSLHVHFSRHRLVRLCLEALDVTVEHHTTLHVLFSLWCYLSLLTCGSNRALT